MHMNDQNHTVFLRKSCSGGWYPVLFKTLLLCVAGVWAGCVTPASSRSSAESDPAGTEAEVDPFLAEAEALYAQGAYAEALRVLMQASRVSPGSPALQGLRNRVLSAMLDQRAVVSGVDEELNRRKALQDARDAGQIPDTFRMRRAVEGAEIGMLRSQAPIQEVLSTPITLHLANANLSTLIRALSEDEAINMIADPALGGNETVDIQASEVPLREILDYLSRHFRVQFHPGRYSIWVTAQDPERSPPMETRIYRLQTGHQFHGLSWGVMPENQRLSDSDISALTRKATVLPEAISYFKEVVEMFVPSEQGGRFHVDLNSHTLFVRNTPENLAVIEEIVRALDTTPPQVLIEARFIEISQSDLREIGIDWILGSPLVVSETQVMENGVMSRQPRTVVGAGSSIEFQPYRSDSAGPFPLGPQGSFGLLRDGNPPTAPQGLNLEYSGLLTEPMFQAVLHALEISGKGRTLSVPRVTTLNNNPAKLRDGDDLLYYEEFQAQAFALVDADNRKYTVTALIPKGTPKTAELGFTLIAVPSVGADNRTISLLLTPTISELLEFISYQEDRAQSDLENNQIRQVVVKLPRISRREVQTKVVVESGETVVMGGLVRTVSQETVRQVPFLSSLPLVGELFKRTDISEEQRNLIIFVTATVISERGESLVPVTGQSGR
jgi:type II secretory pathway component GspD/PulD (secretin)